MSDNIDKVMRYWNDNNFPLPRDITADKWGEGLKYLRENPECNILSVGNVYYDSDEKTITWTFAVRRNDDGSLEQVTFYKGCEVATVTYMPATSLNKKQKLDET
jgi:hypothetical protein